MSVISIIGTGVLFTLVGCGVFAGSLPLFKLPVKKALKRAVYYIPVMEALVALIFCLAAVSPGCVNPSWMGLLLWHFARFVYICIASIITNKALGGLTKSGWAPLLHTGVAAVAAQVIDYLIVRFIIF